MTSSIKSNTLFSVYLLGFFFAFHTALPTYINSSFLNVYLSEDSVGLIYILASIITIASFLVIPFFLRRFGNYRTCLTLIIVELLALLGLAILPSSIWLIILFIVNLVAIPIVYFLTDIFIEGLSTNQKTGRVRGIYLTFINLAWVISPVFSSLILTNNEYWKIYLISFIFLIPTVYILFKKLKNFSDSPYQIIPIWQTLKVIGRDRNLRNIFSANFLLFFFYSWMIIYTPLYLHKEIGFSWTQIGIIFSIMLLPFVLVQYPLGRIADKKWGEKEILSLGFVIAALATMTITFITSRNIVIWASILFLTRIGAATIEIMCDTYFFKKVNSLNANIISFYRMSSPAAYIFGPLIASIILGFYLSNLKYLFLILGLVLLIGLRFSLRLKDTK
jgi:MFS family permease